VPGFAGTSKRETLSFAASAGESVLFTNSLDIKDSYIVNNLLMQKLILSKYRSTELRSNLLKIRLSNLGFARTAPYFEKESDKNKKAIIKLVHLAHINTKNKLDLFGKDNFKNFTRPGHYALRQKDKNKSPFLTLSNRLPTLSGNQCGSDNVEPGFHLSKGLIGELNQSNLSAKNGCTTDKISENKALYLYGNIYKVFEIGVNNNKFKLYPHNFDIKQKGVRNAGDRFKFFRSIFKNFYYQNKSHVSGRSTRASVNFKFINRGNTTRKNHILPALSRKSTTDSKKVRSNTTGSVRSVNNSIMWRRSPQAGVAAVRIAAQQGEGLHSRGIINSTINY
jgi:hypothetical protein